MSKVSFVGILYSFLFISSLYTSTYFNDAYIIPKHYFFAFITLILIIIISLRYTLVKNTIYNITIIDLFVFFYFVYITIHVIILDQFPLEMEYLNQLYLTIIYFLFKPIFSEDNLHNTSKLFNRTVFIILIFIGILQSLYGIFQYIGFFDTANQAFRISGAFGNPGPYSNFLVILFGIGITYSKNYEPGVIKYLSIITSVLILAAIILTKARASWIASIIIIFVALQDIPLIKRIRKYIFNSNLKKSLSIVLLILILFIGINYLLKFKTDSSSGRFFIWKVTIEMIKDKPIFGHGFARFPSVHNNYQASYFHQNHQESNYAMLADGVYYAFNEYLQITSEIGIVGILLFLGIFFLVFKEIFENRIRDENNFIISISLFTIIAILVTSLFSYPLHNLPVQAILYMGIANISAIRSKKLFMFNINGKKRGAMLVLLLFFVSLMAKVNFHRIDAENKWVKAFQMVRKGEFSKAKTQYSKIYKTLKYNPFFLFNYGAELSIMKQYDLSIRILKEAENRINDSDFYIYLGNSYFGIGEYNKALRCFEKASDIMPVKFYPLYRMVLTYDILDQKDKALDLANEILNKPIKVNSKTVQGIRTDMKNYILLNSH